MATLLYEGYLIVASSERIEMTGKWAIWVGLFWQSNGERQRKIFNSVAETFDSKHEAETFGLQIAKDWDQQACSRANSKSPNEITVRCLHQTRSTGSHYLSCQRQTALAQSKLLVLVRGPFAPWNCANTPR